MPIHFDDEVAPPILPRIIASPTLALISQPPSMSDELPSGKALLDDFLAFQWYDTPLTIAQPVPGTGVDDEVLPLPFITLLDDFVAFQWYEPPLAFPRPYQGTSADERSFVITPPLDEDAFQVAAYGVNLYASLGQFALSYPDEGLASLQLEEDYLYFTWRAGTEFTDQQPISDEYALPVASQVDDEYSFTQLSYSAPVIAQPYADTTQEWVPLHRFDDEYRFVQLSYAAQVISQPLIDEYVLPLQHKIVDDDYAFVQVTFTGSGGVQPDSPIPVPYGAYAESTDNWVPPPVPFFLDEDLKLAQLPYGAQLTFDYTQFILPPTSIDDVLYVQPFFYYTLGQAQAILANAGFTIDPFIIWAYSTVVPYYYVISQLPVAGDVISYQSIPIQLTVSAGPPPPTAAYVTVPNVVGQVLLRATRMIDARSLNMGVVSYIQSSAYPVNTVVSQSPLALIAVQSFTSIDLVVCSGPLIDTLIGDPYTVPNVSPTH